MVEVHIGFGEAVKVCLRDTDGEFIIDFGASESNRLTVSADMPDSTERRGVIYEEEWDDSAEGEKAREIQSTSTIVHDAGDSDEDEPAEEEACEQPVITGSGVGHCILPLLHEGDCKAL